MSWNMNPRWPVASSTASETLPVLALRSSARISAGPGAASAACGACAACAASVGRQAAPRQGAEHDRQDSRLRVRIGAACSSLFSCACGKLGQVTGIG